MIYFVRLMLILLVPFSIFAFVIFFTLDRMGKSNKEALWDNFDLACTVFIDMHKDVWCQDDSNE